MVYTGAKLRITSAVFSPSKIQSMIGGHYLGRVYDHIKAFRLTHHSHIKETSVVKACWASMP